MVNLFYKIGISLDYDLDTLSKSFPFSLFSMENTIITLACCLSLMLQRNMLATPIHYNEVGL